MGLEISKINMFKTSNYKKEQPLQGNEFKPLYEFNEQSRINKSQENDVKKNIEQAKKNGSLKYHPAKKNIFFERKAEYEYHANGRETISMIMKKFGLKKGAINKCNSYISDKDWIPPKGQKIFFYASDVNEK